MGNGFSMHLGLKYAGELMQSPLTKSDEATRYLLLIPFALAHRIFLFLVEMMSKK